MSETKTRRAALGALAGLPAIALLPAVASPTSTARLDELIAAYDAAFVVIQNADEDLDELMYPPDAPFIFSADSYP
jgi:hypothetical protein